LSENVAAKAECFDYSKVDAVLEKYAGKRGSVIPILQHVQDEYGFLPRQALERVAKRLHVPISKIYGVATFYAQFHLQPRGKNIIRVCKGTACHVRGGAKIAEKLEELLGIKVGETTEDMKFTLEQVACIGACGLSPVMMINENTHGRLTPQKIKKILKLYE